MPRAQVLLFENIHPSADEVFGQHDILVHRRSGSLFESDSVEFLDSIASSVPCLIGIRSKTKLDRKTISSIPNLLAIGAFCIGTDQIDLEFASDQGIPVFNAPFSNTRSVAELVLGEIVMLSRQIFPRNQATHAGRWSKTATGSHEIRGKTLGIVGYGHIGSQLSVLAEAMGLRVRFYDVLNKLPLGNANPCRSLQELLKCSNFLTLHVPDTEITRNLIGQNELQTMQRGSFLINASRGCVVDLEALRDQITTGHIAGAAIDVFPQEPSQPDRPFECNLRGLSNVILTPHIGGSTEEAQANIGREVSHYLCSFLASGATSGNHTVPELETTPLRNGCRLINVHYNVPGVLSAVNSLIADAELNIEAQHLTTKNNLGLLSVDLAVTAEETQAILLQRNVDRLQSSIRTLLLSS